MFILMSLMTQLASATGVTAQNWMSHPEITQIRLLRKQIEDDGKHPAWTVKKEDMAQCAGQTLSKRAVLLDPQGTIRRYKAQGTENGVSFSTTQYYNKEGRLRFVHLRLTHDEQQASTEYTTFLDVHGSRLFEHVQRTTDDGAVLPGELPERHLVLRPKKSWAKTNPCGTR